MTCDAEVSLIETAHKLAMSPDPRTACRGRLLKEIGPGFMRWAEDEVGCRLFAPGADPLDRSFDVVVALSECFAGLMAAMAQAMVREGTPPAAVAAGLDIIASVTNGSARNIADHLRNSSEEGVGQGPAAGEAPAAGPRI